MFKTSPTVLQARNIAMALTMTFAATTLVTACGNDDNVSTSSQKNQTSVENQHSSSEENELSEAYNNMQDDSEVSAESKGSDAVVETAESETNVEVEETDSASIAHETTTPAAEKPTSEGPKTHTVLAQGLIYIPLVVTIDNGDTVAWRNMPTHNTKSIEGLIPEGTEHWESPINENYERTFTQDGIYVYKCVPHFGAGMGGVVIVGEPVNLEQIKNADAKGAARRLVRKGIAEAEKL